MDQKKIIILLIVFLLLCSIIGVVIWGATTNWWAPATTTTPSAPAVVPQPAQAPLGVPQPSSQAPLGVPARTPQIGAPVGAPARILGQFNISSVTTTNFTIMSIQNTSTGITPSENINISVTPGINLNVPFSSLISGYRITGTFTAGQPYSVTLRTSDGLTVSTSFTPARTSTLGTFGVLPTFGQTSISGMQVSITNSIGFTSNDDITITCTPTVQNLPATMKWSMASQIPGNFADNTTYTLTFSSPMSQPVTITLITPIRNTFTNFNVVSSTPSTITLDTVSIANNNYGQYYFGISIDDVSFSLNDLQLSSHSVQSTISLGNISLTPGQTYTIRYYITSVINNLLNYPISSSTQFTVPSGPIPCTFGLLGSSHADIDFDEYDFPYVTFTLFFTGVKNTDSLIINYTGASNQSESVSINSSPQQTIDAPFAAQIITPFKNSNYSFRPFTLISSINICGKIYSFTLNENTRRAYVTLP